jgi:uncharacterized protein involved in cysteine biosynthesis
LAPPLPARAVGFGITGLVALLIPFADLLVAPALAAGATLLVLDLEDRDGEGEWRETYAKRYQ